MLSKQIQVDWAGTRHPIWVAESFDQHLDAFALEVGGQLDDERCPFGVLLWPCARSFAQFLVEDSELTADQPLRIAELGCGVGFISCVLASVFPHAEILACDYEAGLAAMVERNAAAWGLADRVRFVQMDWRNAVPANLRKSCDWVVGTDVFYDDSHLTHLPPCAAELLHAQGKLLLADPKRYRFSRALELLSEQFQLERHVERSCSMQQEGIEDFMITASTLEQSISILQLRPRTV